MSHGTFSGEPRTVWLTQKAPDRCMEPLEEFWFDDPKGDRWRAPQGTRVDGASIPRALWTVVGSPFTGDYRRASIVHDKACVDAAGDPAKRRAADRMFFHACRAGGCSTLDSIILYIGVRIGAWTPLVPAWMPTTPSEHPRAVRTPDERRIEIAFELTVHKVLAQGGTDDPAVLEGRTESALAVVAASFQLPQGPRAGGLEIT